MSDGRDLLLASSAWRSVDFTMNGTTSVVVLPPNPLRVSLVLGNQITSNQRWFTHLTTAGFELWWNNVTTGPRIITWFEVGSIVQAGWSTSAAAANSDGGSVLELLASVKAWNEYFRRFRWVDA